MTTIYVYSGTQVIAESEVFTPVQGSPTTTLTEYLYAGSQMVASITGGTAKYHLRDHLSARVTTDSSGGNAVEQAQYPFGEDWYAGSGASKFKFTSYERDTAQSDYAVFRNYHYLTGRFNRPDPLAGSILDPQSLNRYGYTRNDPINMIDPLGLAWICAMFDFYEDGKLIPESGHCHYEWIPDFSPFGQGSGDPRVQRAEQNRADAKAAIKREQCAAFLAAVLSNLQNAENTSASGRGFSPTPETILAQQQSRTRQAFLKRLGQVRFQSSNDPSRYLATTPYGGNTVHLHAGFEDYSEGAALVWHETFHTLSGGSWTDAQLAAAANVPVTRMKNESDEDYQQRVSNAFQGQIEKYCGVPKK